MVTKVFVLDEACLIAELGILNHISYLLLFLMSPHHDGCDFTQIRILIKW